MNNKPLAKRENKRKNPMQINESFTCLNCGKSSPKAQKTCRNHCRECLYSLHVDQNVPGDRQSNCHGLMKPLLITRDGKKGLQIIHHCLKCAKEIANKTAEDDNLDLITKIMQEQNIIPPDAD